MAYAGDQPADAWDEVTDTDGLTFGAELRKHLALEADLPRRGLGVVGGPSPSPTSKRISSRGRGWRQRAWISAW